MTFRTTLIGSILSFVVVITGVGAMVSVPISHGPLVPLSVAQSSGPARFSATSQQSPQSLTAARPIDVQPSTAATTSPSTQTPLRYSSDPNDEETVGHRRPIPNSYEVPAPPGYLHFVIAGLTMNVPSTWKITEGHIDTDKFWEAKDPTGSYLVRFDYGVKNDDDLKSYPVKTDAIFARSASQSHYKRLALMDSTFSNRPAFVWEFEKVIGSLGLRHRTITYFNTKVFHGALMFDREDTPRFPSEAFDTILQSLWIVREQ